MATKNQPSHSHSSKHRHTKGDNQLHSAQTPRQPKKPRAFHSEFEIAERLAERFGGISLFSILMLVLAGLILWTGVIRATETQQYLQDYKGLQDMKQEHRKLQVEHQRLLIEQQTFSSTPQIASRAVDELDMFFPEFKDKMILQPLPIVSSVDENNVNTKNSDSTHSQTNETKSNQRNSEVQP